MRSVLKTNASWRSGLSPPSATPQGPDVRALGERLEAIIGFCGLIQSRARDMNTDYAAYAAGAVTVVATHPHTPTEPALAPYVWARPPPTP